MCLARAPRASPSVLPNKLCATCGLGQGRYPGRGPTPAGDRILARKYVRSYCRCRCSTDSSGRGSSVGTIVTLLVLPSLEGHEFPSIDFLRLGNPGSGHSIRSFPTANSKPKRVEFGGRSYHIGQALARRLGYAFAGPWAVGSDPSGFCIHPCGWQWFWLA